MLVCFSEIHDENISIKDNGMLFLYYLHFLIALVVETVEWRIKNVSNCLNLNYYCYTQIFHKLHSLELSESHIK